MVNTQNDQYSTLPNRKHQRYHDVGDAIHSELYHQMSGWTEKEISGLVTEGKVPGKKIRFMYL